MRAAPESARQRGDRAQLAVERDRGEQRERDELAGPDSVSTSHRPASAPSRFAPVSPSIARSRRSYSPATSAGATNSPSDHSGRSVARADRQARAEQHERLGRASGAQVEQVEDVRREHEHRRRPAASARPTGLEQLIASSARPSEPAALSAPVDSSPRSAARAVAAPAARTRAHSARVARRSSPSVSSISPSASDAERVHARSEASRGGRPAELASCASSTSGISANSAAASDQHAERKRQRAPAVVGPRVTARCERAQHRRARAARRSASATRNGRACMAWKLASRADATALAARAAARWDACRGRTRAHRRLVAADVRQQRVGASALSRRRRWEPASA